MKNSVLILFFFITASTFFSCKKYEEGPALSFRSKKERVANKWTVNQVTTTNLGVGSTTFQSSFFIELTKDGDVLDESGEKVGVWSFNDDKTQIILLEDGSEEEYKIIELKEDQMQLTRSIGNGGVGSSLLELTLTLF
jgi:hypothetical protein